MSEIRGRKVSLKHAEPPSDPRHEPPPSDAGGLSASLALIRQGHVPLKHVDPAAAATSKAAPLLREPSGSIASALRRRLAQRKLALDGASPGAAAEVDDDDEWA